MSKMEYVVTWMEAKNPQTKSFGSEYRAKDKAVEMSQMWGIAEVHQWNDGEDKSFHPLGWLQKWTYTKGRLSGQFDPPGPGPGNEPGPNKVKSAEASAVEAGLMKPEEVIGDGLDLPASLDRKKNGIKPASSPIKPGSSTGSAFSPSSASKKNVPINPTSKQETTMTESQTETNTATTKKPAAKKASPPAKKAAAKPAAKKAAAKVPAKKPAVKTAKKEGKPKKESKPKVEAKPYVGPHEKIWEAIGQKTTSKIGMLLALLLKNEGNQVKLSKVTQVVYGGDEEAASGFNTRVNQLVSDIEASTVAKRVEIKRERKTADKEGTIGIYIK